MLIINPLKPFYIDKKNKIIRMGNFIETGKEIEYSDDCFLEIFNNLKKPILKKDLIELVSQKTNIDINEISNVIQYLIEEHFIVDNTGYNLLLKDEKYSRQNLFLNIFNDSYVSYNNVFRNKNIVILGLGGVGSNVAFMLSRAGFDTFTLVDYDSVEKSNLIRQYPYNFNDVDNLKTDCLDNKLNNSKILKKNVKIEKEEDILKEIKNADFVLCTLDKPTRIIRRIINSVCIKCNKPVIFAGFAEHVAMIGPFVIPNKTACLVCSDRQMLEVPLNNVAVTPSYGPLCAIISSIVVNEIINYFSKYNSNTLVGKTLMFNMCNYETKIINWNKNKKCKVCGVHDSK